MTSQHKAIWIMRAVLVWSSFIVLFDVFVTHRWSAAATQAVLGAGTYLGLKRYMAYVETLKPRPVAAPRVLLRKDGRRCIARRSERAWHEPALTYCEEMVGTPQDVQDAPTCLICIEGKDHG